MFLKKGGARIIFIAFKKWQSLVNNKFKRGGKK